MIRAVIFDLDGTLIHSLPGLAASLNRILQANHLPTHTELSVRGFIGNGIKKLIERATPCDTPEKTIQRLTQQMSEDYASSWQSGTSPYPGITTILNNLAQKKIALAVFSNKPHIFCQEMTDHLFPEISFTTVLGQRDGVPAKPDPTGAYEVAKSLDHPPEDIAFLGDSTIDIATARNAGMLPIAATWGYHDLPALEAEHPARLIHHIEDLPDIIIS